MTMQSATSKWIILTILLTIHWSSAQEIVQSANPEETESKQIRGFQEDNNWRAIDLGTSGWIPHNSEQVTEEEKPKRRRLRKRKRRPAIISLTDEVTGEVVQKEIIYPRRRIRPQRLDLAGDELNMEEEVLRRPYIRRRIPPAYEEGTKEQKESKLDLKTLLKQSGGLSLSEILQQKNLSLAELLKGDQKAISALTEKPSTTEQPKIEKDINRNYQQDEESVESTSTREALEDQRKELEQLNKETKPITETILTESTTEKRIFVPSHPKYYTSLNFKPDFIDVDPVTTFVEKESTSTSTTTTSTTTSTTTTTTSTPATAQTELTTKNLTRSKLPITSAKLNKLKQKGEENYPTTTSKPSKTEDEPFKMSFDLEKLSKKEEDNIITPSLDSTLGSSNSESMLISSAKDEINEILKDPISREKLARILKTRNMTLEELVEQRERGSSQLHLADIFHNNTKEPEPMEEPLIGSVSEELLEAINRQQKSRQLDVDLTKTEAVEVVKPKDMYTVTSFPTFKIELNKKFKEEPIWKDLYPSLFPELEHNEIQKTESDFPNVDRIEEVDNDLSSMANEKLNVELLQDYEEEFIKLPNGVKSAIIASLAIIGLSLLVFVTILVIFRWNQKQKQRLNYTNSFSSKIKSPILQTEKRRSIRSFVCETLGKKTNSYYNRQLKTMADNIWEGDRKPSF